MTPEQLRERVQKDRELLDRLDNMENLHKEILNFLQHTPQGEAIFEVQYGTCGHLTFSAPLHHLVPLLNRLVHKAVSDIENAR